MKIIAILDVDEKKLEETGHTFEEEMGWASQSGITLKKYEDITKSGEYEYAAFAWNKNLKTYEQMGRAVISEQLCRNRYEEYVNNGCFQPCYDPAKVMFQRRLIATIYEPWEPVN